MPHECHDREDLLRDARALVPRVQIKATLGGQPVSLFAGFRGEALSLYYNADPVFHFNADGALRRAFGVPKTFGLLPGRVTYVIDGEGVVRHIFSGQFVSDRHVREALDAVRALG
jgi:hypothetical protein